MLTVYDHNQHMRESHPRAHTGGSVDAFAPSEKGWTISAFAGHLGRDRKPLHGGSWFDDYVGHARPRLRDDPHLCAKTRFEEPIDCGFDRS